MSDHVTEIEEAVNRFDTMDCTVTEELPNSLLNASASEVTQYLSTIAVIKPMLGKDAMWNQITSRLMKTEQGAQIIPYKT